MIVITRPKSDSKALITELEKSDIPLISLPLIELQTIDLEQQLEAKLLTYSKEISSHTTPLKHFFASPNSVKFALPYLHKYFPDFSYNFHEIYAIGERTAEALKMMGYEKITIAPSPYNSESLLSLPSLGSIEAHAPHCLLWSMLGGRALLQSTLTQRGFIVQNLPIYKQKKVSLTREDRKSLEKHRRRHKCFIFTATSQSIIEQLKSTAICHQEDYVVCFSERIARYARECSFSNVHVVDEANNKSLINKLIEVYKRCF